MSQLFADSNIKALALYLGIQRWKRICISLSKTKKPILLIAPGSSEEAKLPYLLTQVHWLHHMTQP